jgi:hypothetical protein
LKGFTVALIRPHSDRCLRFQQARRQSSCGGLGRGEGWDSDQWVPSGLGLARSLRRNARRRGKAKRTIKSKGLIMGQGAACTSPRAAGADACRRT